jgi:hypothetical protein
VLYFSWDVCLLEKCREPLHKTRGTLFSETQPGSARHLENPREFLLYVQNRDIFKLLTRLPAGVLDKKLKTSSASPTTPSVLMPPLKLRRKVMINSEIPENHMLANLEAHQVITCSRPTRTLPLYSPFLKAAQDLFSGKYPTTAIEATNFAALYLQFTHGDYIASNQVVNVNNIKSFIAPYIFSSSGLGALQWTEALHIHSL